MSADAQIQQTKTPYELLFRWSDAGSLQGAHVVWLLRILDANGNLISSQTSEAQSVSVAGSEGFPLADLLSTALTDALARIDDLTAQTLALTQQLEDMGDDPQSSP